MSWDDIKQTEVTAEERKRLKAEHKQEAIDLAKSYHNVFKTDAGQRVITDLSKKFIMDNDTPFNAPNIDYESAYHNGEAGIVKYIINQISRAETL